MKEEYAEKELYPSIMEWLKNYLEDRFKQGKVFTFNTSGVVLYKFLQEKGFSEYFPDYQAFEIMIDITGIIVSNKSAKLVFVEVKKGAISLKEISQLLGYSIIAKPEFSFLISPEGLSNRMNYLLNQIKHLDVLYYDKENNTKFIRIARWDIEKEEIIPESIIPKGSHILV